MENLIFQIPVQGEKPELLNMGGKDKEGNLYQVDRKSLILNGKRMMPVMGEIHFSRVEPESWREELLKMRAGGITVTATYVFWNHHEQRPGEWDFEGSRNLRGFLQTCKDLDMKVWFRIGPWVHGESRHGGFPDFIQYAQDFEPRTNDPVYLDYVRKFWGKLAEQAEGMMCGDGGPIIGIQLENEYGHCGGPADKAEQAAHLKALYDMAKELGMNVPFYTATAWGGACTIDETLQVLAGYVDAPWDASTEELPAMENYLFIPYRDDTNTGSDFHKADGPSGTIRDDYPYLTAELGGGLQCTSHRRLHATGADNAGHIATVLGAGANVVGYYMYHGGINPTCKHYDVNESQPIGGHTNVPRKSYDFDTCINEAGKLSESFGMLKKYHYLMTAFEENLAGAETVLPEILPENAEDTQTIRAALRWNYDTQTGYLFVNNHVRNRVMAEHQDVKIQVFLPDGKELVLEGFHFAESGTYVYPINLQTEKLTIKKTNASLLCRLGERVFLYTDEKLMLEAEGDTEKITVLPETEANRCFLFEDGLYVVETADSCIICDNGVKKLLTEKAQTVKVYREDGSVETVSVAPGAAVLKTTEKLAASFELIKEDFDKFGALRSRFYQVKLDNVKEADANQLYLNVDYLGDRAEVYADGELIDDWFTTGMPWNIALRRFGYPESLVIRVIDSNHPIPCKFSDKVFYDIPVEPGCEIRAMKLIPEYTVEM